MQAGVFAIRILRDRLLCIATRDEQYWFYSWLGGTIGLTVVNGSGSRSAEEGYETQTHGGAHSADRRTPPPSWTHFKSERPRSRLLNWDINVRSTVCVRLIRWRQRRDGQPPPLRRLQDAHLPLNPSPSHTHTRTHARDEGEARKYVECWHAQQETILLWKESLGGLRLHFQKSRHFLLK